MFLMVAAQAGFNALTNKLKSENALSEEGGYSGKDYSRGYSSR
jgi:hypothetical protein